MKALAIALLPLLLISMTTCGGSDEPPGETTSSPSTNDTGDAKPFGVRGEIIRITAPVEGASGSQGSLFIEGRVEDDTQFARASVWLTDETAYLRRQGADNVPANLADMEIGSRVEVKFNGEAIGGSLVIATAAEVTILE